MFGKADVWLLIALSASNPNGEKPDNIADWNLTDNLPAPNEINEEDKRKAREVFLGNELASDADLASPGKIGRAHV